jgi:hypothetical protein
VAHDGGIVRGVNVSKEGPDQCDISRAGHQKPDRKPKLHPLAGCVDHGFHGRDHPAILLWESRGFFFAKFISRLRLRTPLQKGHFGPISANERRLLFRNRTALLALNL